jgi:hypothetical protein
LVDLLSILVAAVAGAGVGGVVAYAVFSSTRKVTVAVPAKRAGGRAKAVTVTVTELERSRREMRTMMVERDLLSEALMRLYGAETEGRITKEEREMITRRYSGQIKDLQNKLKDVELVVEVGELEKLRGELVGLFDEKIGNIDARLDQAREKLSVTALPEAPKAQTRAVQEQGEDDLEKAVEKKERPDVSEGERRVKVLRDELLEAMTKLEQIDMDKNKETA